MAVAFRGRSTAHSQGVGDIVVTTPATPSAYQEDDLLLLLVCGEGDGSHPATITGWTQLDSVLRSQNSGVNDTVSLSVWWKIAGASESSVTVPDLGAQTMGIMLAYSGVDTVDPFDEYSTSTNGTNSISQTVPAITPTNDNCGIVGICAIGDNNAIASNYVWTGSLALTSDAAISGAGSDNGMSWAFGVQTTAASTGVLTCTTQSEESAMFNIALNEAAGGTGATVPLSTQAVTVSPGDIDTAGAAVTELASQTLTALIDSIAVAIGADAPLDGQALAFSQGGITGYEQKFLAITLASGGTTVPLSGQQINSAIGAPVVSGAAAVDLSGQGVSANIGQVTAQGAAQVVIAGQPVSVDLGSVATFGAASIDLTGQQIVSAQGSPIVDSGGDFKTVPLVGQQINTALGNIVSSGAAKIDLTGQTVAADQGTISFAGGAVVPLSGQQSTTAYSSTSSKSLFSILPL